jgi:hypothetical protein
VTLTSFVAWDPAAERPVDRATLAFRDAGDAPLLVTLGSNGAIDPDDFFDHAARVGLDARLRVLVVTGPGQARHNLAGLDGVHVTDYAPVSWLCLTTGGGKAMSAGPGTATFSNRLACESRPARSLPPRRFSRYWMRPAGNPETSSRSPSR